MRSPHPLSLGFIGAGVVGSALARLLAGAGYPVVGVASRRSEAAKDLAALLPGCLPCSTPQEVAARAKLVFITTPDEAIAPVATQVLWRPGQRVVHCSGALPLAILEPARQSGALVGGLHPLQSLATLEEALANLPGSTFAVEAESPLWEELVAMVEALGGRWLRLRGEDRALYHAAAVLASNYVVTLAHLAAELLAPLEDTPQRAATALLPLLRGTLCNLERVGLPHALSGPIARGDVATVRAHLEALQQRAPDLLLLYRELARHTLPLAEAKGKLAPERAQELRLLLAEAYGPGTAALASSP